MHPLSAAQWLDAWERGLAQDSIDRALTFLAAASPDTPRAALAELPIGVRDRLLLTLREWTLGSHVVGALQCPHCGERVELAFDLAEVRAPEPSSRADTHSLRVDGYAVTFRLPNSQDLRAVSLTADVTSAAGALLESCLVKVEEAHSHPAGELPSNLVQAITDEMASADPQANVQLALSCPYCEHAWSATFDIAGFFWTEIDAWARRVLREVHTLASAYGWRQAEILALSPQRRQMYLEMIGE